MNRLECSYAGLKLRSPLTAASSPLTTDMAHLKALEEAGIGAVVLKSVFEEQIESESKAALDGLSAGEFADASVYFENFAKNTAVDASLGLLEEAKKTLSVPVFVSLNCVRDGSWYEYAKRAENVGADALELNLFILPSDAGDSSADLERRYLQIIKKTVQSVSIPVCVKLGSYFTGMTHFLKEAAGCGVKGIVLFNRYYNIDFDIDSEKVVPAAPLSSPDEYLTTLRWIALSAAELPVDFAAATGIYSAETAFKMIAAGAKTVQLCSVLMKDGVAAAERMRSELLALMDRKGYASLSDFCGKMAQERSADPAVYERHQYIRFLTGSEQK